MRFRRVGHAIGCGFSTGFPGRVATEPASCGALVTRAIARANEYSDGDREGTVAEANNHTRREGSHSSDKIPDRKVFVCMGGKQNTEKGLAPSYAALWKQFAHEVDHEAIRLQGEPDAPPGSDKHKRQRMQRWSRRWRVVQGRYKAGLRLPLETLRQKANVDSEL